MPDYTVQSVQDALLLLRCFDYYHNSLSLIDLTERTGIAKSKVFRLLRTLEGLNFIVQDPSSGLYHLGDAALLLGRVSRYDDQVQRVVDHMLKEINKASGETVNFAVIQGKKLVYAAIVESPSPFRMTERLGDEVPWVTASLGRAVLAYHPTPLIFIAPDQLQELAPLLERVRAQGYALDDQEVELGVRCVGMPVRDGHGMIIGACSISAPAVRLPIASLERVISLLRTEVAVAEAQLRALQNYVDVSMDLRG